MVAGYRGRDLGLGHCGSDTQAADAAVGVDEGAPRCSGHRRAAWRNAGAASYADALEAKGASSTPARLPDPLSARHFALVFRRAAWRNAA